MKAIIWTNYGSPDVLQIQEVEKPTPKDNEVLIKIHATTVTAGDCEMRGFKFPLWLWIPVRVWLGLIKPRMKILGQDLAGEIEAVGKDVTRFKQGDQVFASPGMRLGAYAEYICLPEALDDMVLELKPSHMTYEEAVAIPTWALIALYFLRKAQIQPGQKVLINGAAGSIGTYGVQLAKHFGAEVTGVDRGDKLEMLRAIGADHVIDYTREDFTRNGETYDVIFDIVGKVSYSQGKRSLAQKGYYLLANPSFLSLIRGAWSSSKSAQTVVFDTGSDKPGDVILLKELIEEGAIKTIIDKRYPLEQIAEAHRYVETGFKKGHVIITVT